MRYRGFRRAILSTLRNFMAVDPTPLFEGLHGRDVLLFWGAEDHTLPIATSDRLRAEYDPEFHRIEDAGHLPHLEQPEVVEPVLIEFLSRT
jgi:pimeloyl-ACP methyl ester carboxylesterase